MHGRGMLSPSLLTRDHHRTANQLNSNIKFKEKKKKRGAVFVDLSQITKAKTDMTAKNSN